MKSQIVLIIQTDYEHLMEKATKAKKYMQKEKSPKAQANRIIEMWEKMK